MINRFIIKNLILKIGLSNKTDLKNQFLKNTNLIDRFIIKTDLINRFHFMNRPITPLIHIIRDKPFFYAKPILKIDFIL